MAFTDGWTWGDLSPRPTSLGPKAWGRCKKPSDGGCSGAHILTVGAETMAHCHGRQNLQDIVLRGSFPFSFLGAGRSVKALLEGLGLVLVRISYVPSTACIWKITLWLHGNEEKHIIYYQRWIQRVKKWVFCFSALPPRSEFHHWKRFSIWEVEVLLLLCFIGVAVT